MTFDAGFPEHVLYERLDSHIGLVMLNRPEKRNAISPDIASMLELIVETTDPDPEIRVMIIKSCDHRSVDSDHPHTGHFGWTREHNRFGWDAMLGDMDRAAVPPHASAARATDLSGLPATFIHIGAIDLFLEESLDHARRLTRAGVAVELHVWPGAFHAFGAYDTHVSHEARRVARTAIKRALHGDAK